MGRVSVNGGETQNRVFRIPNHVVGYSADRTYQAAGAMARWESSRNPEDVLAQTVAANRPNLVLNTHNGHPTTDTDDVDDFLFTTATTGTPFSVIPGLTHITVVRTNNPAVAGQLIWFTANEQVSINTNTYSYIGSDIVGLAFVDIATAVGGGRTAALNMITWRFDGTQATDALRLQMFANGVKQTLTFSATFGTRTGVSAALVSHSSVGASPLVGDLAEFQVYARALNPGEQQVAERQLARKWGIPYLG